MSPLFPPPATAAVVTGGAAGIGLEITRSLARARVNVLAVGRDADRGRAAAAAVAAETGATVRFCAADLADPASLTAVVDAVGEAPFRGNLHLLINNASIAYKGDAWGADEAKATVHTNYVGTARLTHLLLPCLAPPARIVTVASRSGVAARRGMGAALGARFDDAAASSTAAVDALAAEFVAAVADGSWQAAGWPRSMYGVSKLAQIAWTRALNAQLARDARGVVAVCCCPGSVSTAMSSFRGVKTPAEGADTPVWLALEAAEEEVGGKFFGERQEILF